MEQLQAKVKALFADHYIPAHDIKHVLRVAGLAKLIAQSEGVSAEEAEAAGLLHDLGRILQQEEQGHDQAGVELAKELLDDLSHFTTEAKDRIIAAIEQHSAKESDGALAHILQDADKIDGLGAIGLIRAYTSKSHLPDYPEGVIVSQGSRTAATISEQVAFQLEWFEMLYTDSARQIALQRYKFMQDFMLELKREVDESLQS